MLKILKIPLCSFAEFWSFQKNRKEKKKKLDRFSDFTGSQTLPFLNMAGARSRMNPTIGLSSLAISRIKWCPSTVRILPAMAGRAAGQMDGGSRMKPIIGF